MMQSEPVGQSEPNPTEQAVDDMRAILKANRDSMAFGAPEMQDVFWERMAERLEDLIRDLRTGI